MKLAYIVTIITQNLNFILAVIIEYAKVLRNGGVCRHSKTDGLGRVKWVTGHFKRVKNGFGSIGLRVGLTRIFHMIFFLIFLLFIIIIKKTTCICHLESYATNYLM